MGKSERSTHEDTDDSHWIKVNVLNRVYSFIFEEKCQSIDLFYAKDIEKKYLEILSKHGIQYEFHTSRFASLQVSNDDLQKLSIVSKATICFTACADTIFKDMRYEEPWHNNLFHERCCKAVTKVDNRKAEHIQRYLWYRLSTEIDTNLISDIGRYAYWWLCLCYS